MPPLRYDVVPVLGILGRAVDGMLVLLSLTLRGVSIPRMTAELTRSEMPVDSKVAH